VRRLAAVVLSACLAGCQTGPSGPDAPGPPSTAPTPIPEGPLSGRWVGPTAEEMGVINYSAAHFHRCARNCVDYCRNFYNVEEATLSHQGTRLSGTMITTFGGAECLSGGVMTRVPAAFGGGDRHPHVLNMSVTPSGGVSVAWADAGPLGGGPSHPVNQDLTGTYTADSITVSGEREGGTGLITEAWSITFRLRRP
jgi:hypothetical protein